MGLTENMISCWELKAENERLHDKIDQYDRKFNKCATCVNLPCTRRCFLQSPKTFVSACSDYIPEEQENE